MPDYVHETGSKSNVLKLKDVLKGWIEHKGTDATQEVLLAAIEGPLVKNRIIRDKIYSFFSVENTSIIKGNQLNCICEPILYSAKFFF